MSKVGCGIVLFSRLELRKLKPWVSLILGSSFYFLPPQVDVLIFLKVFDFISCVLEGPGPENDLHPFLLSLYLSYQLWSLFLKTDSFQFVSVFWMIMVVSSRGSCGLKNICSGKNSDLLSLCLSWLLMISFFFSFLFVVFFLTYSLFLSSICFFFALLSKNSIDDFSLSGSINFYQFSLI